MLHKIIEKLKSIKPVRDAVKNVKKTGKLFIGMRKRHMKFLLHSPGVTLRKSRRSFADNGKLNTLVGIIGLNALEGITAHSDVLSYPIKTGTGIEYTGGLINRSTFEMIKPAIHIGNAGQFTQRVPDISEVVPNGELIIIEHPVLYGGILFHHFGHFLIESLGRLWAYDVIRGLDPFILFYIDNIFPPYLEKRNFIYQVLIGFKIPPEKLLFINKPALIKLVIVPEQKYGFTFRQHPDAIFIKFIRSLRTDPKVPSKFRSNVRLYVSRSKIPIGRVMGESHFEQYLQLEGYTVFHPECYTLNQQLAIYRKAEKIVFCDGSSIHSCILLPDLRADIAVIARRYDRNSAARNILWQFEGYNKNTLWIDCIKEQYQFGLESWHALSVVDWLDVSKVLKEAGFVDCLYSAFHEIDFPALLRSELCNHMEVIKGFPEYTDFMISLKEQLPAIS